MAKVSPWYSRLPSAYPVYHDETECDGGNKIAPENRVDGIGDRPKCRRCTQISASHRRNLGNSAPRSVAKRS